jgi:chemotaxis protein MotB
MMCFFLVMWLMGADEETKAQIEHYFNHPETPWKAGRDPQSDVVRPMGDQAAEGDSILNGLEGLQPDDLAPQNVQPTSRPSAAQKELTEMAELAKEQMDQKAFNFDVTVEYLKFSLPESLFFRPGEFKLAPDSARYLARLGQIVRGYKGYVVVAGHADDSVDETGHRHGYEFSTARAVSVMNYLIERNYIGDERISAVGKGSKIPLASNGTADGREKNRRMEFTLQYERPQ